jgi:peptide/nickel transport system substrate-binding protein
MDYPDPANFFEALFSSEAINDEQSTNYAFYRNREVDDLIAQARHEQDKEARLALYTRANHIVCDEAPWAFTFSARFFDVRQPYVRGFSSHAVWSFYVGDTWLDRAGDVRERALGTLWGLPGPSRRRRAL